MFLNLLNNAAKYSEPNGRICVSVDRVGCEVEIRVQDAGIGIGAIHLPHVFEDFVQVDREWKRTQGGLGIGLSLVKEFVGLHGGHVDAFSKGLGKGSKFSVRLPAALESKAVDSPAIPAQEAEVPKCRILVVDDNVDSAGSLALLLEMMGHDTRTAYDGEAGVQAASEFRPHVILMDLGMPILDGYEAARRIRGEPWGDAIFLVALSGWGADEDRLRTHDAGFDLHLLKPVDLKLLSNAMAEMPTCQSR